MDLWKTQEPERPDIPQQRAEFGAYSTTSLDDLDDLIDPITLRDTTTWQGNSPTGYTSANGNVPASGRTTVNGYVPPTGNAPVVGRPPVNGNTSFSSAPPVNGNTPFGNTPFVVACPPPVSPAPPWSGSPMPAPPVSPAPRRQPGPTSGIPVSPPPRISRPVPPPPEVEEPDDVDVDVEEAESDGTYRGAALSALVWCTLPMALFIGWALLLARGPQSGCVDNNGQPCAGPSVIAWGELPYIIPVVGVATLLSVLIALMLRRITTGWRSSTVGFASAVVAAGVVTVFWSALGRG